MMAPTILIILEGQFAVEAALAQTGRRPAAWPLSMTVQSTHTLALM